jgi:bacillithiol system protein YtxJ
MFFSKKNSPARFVWNEITTPDHVDKIIEESEQKPVVFFKHSGRCTISAMALNRFEDYAKEIDENSILFMIDVVNHRPASLHAAEMLGVVHQSPQILVIHHGKAIYDNSHGAIDGRHVLKIIKELNPA